MLHISYTFNYDAFNKNYFNQRLISVNKEHNYHKYAVTHFHGAVSC